MSDSEETAQALLQWLAENPSADVGSVGLLDDHETVVISWKGDPPAEFREFAAGLPAPVTIREAAYSRNELLAVVRSLVEANPGVVSSAGPSSDFSGIAITLSSAAPDTALAALRAQSPVPVELRGTRDIMTAPASGEAGAGSDEGQFRSRPG